MSCTKGQGIFSSIAIPATAKALEINLDFVTLINAYQFTTMEHEDPYSSLDTFYELVGAMAFKSGDILYALVSFFIGM